jgi:hypothetical protein
MLEAKKAAEAQKEAAKTAEKERIHKENLEHKRGLI